VYLHTIAIRIFDGKCIAVFGVVGPAGECRNAVLRGRAGGVVFVAAEEDNAPARGSECRDYRVVGQFEII
jgi:hypothetical protein